MLDKREIFKLYRDAPFFFRAYLKIKLKICPLIALEDFFPEKGSIVDLGCGSGLFPKILSLGCPERRIFGLDLDKRKIEAANQSESRDLNITYRVGDVVEADYPKGNVFSLVDVLYLIPYDKQEVILRKCYQTLPEGGILVVKEMDTRPRLKYLWNLFQEMLAVKLIGFTLGEKFFFRSQEDYLNILRQLGFSVKTIPLHSGYWYPHIAYICTK